MFPTKEVLVYLIIPTPPKYLKMSINYKNKDSGTYVSSSLKSKCI